MREKWTGLAALVSLDPAIPEARSLLSLVWLREPRQSPFFGLNYFELDLFNL